VASLRIDLFGSLALTGIGHGTPDSILMGKKSVIILCRQHDIIFAH